MGVSYAGQEHRATPGNSARRAARRELQTEIISELERAEASTAAIHYVLTVLLPHSELTWGMIAQRVRQAKERRGRLARQESEKPALKQRCVAAFAAVCAYCDRGGSPTADPDGKPWNLDRITPGAVGGEYEPSNVALACHACNQRKGANITFLPPPSLAELEASRAPTREPAPEVSSPLRLRGGEHLPAQEL